MYNFSALTLIQDYGSGDGCKYLTYASKSVYDVLLRVEEFVAEKISCANSLWGDIFFECLDNLNIIAVKTSQLGCCEDHVLRTLPKLVFHYLKCRFFFRTKEIRKELSASKTAKSYRKFSKLSSC